MTDTQIKEHGERTHNLAKRFAKLLNLNNRDTNLLLNASKLHDVGKFGLSEKILNKPTKLNDIEYEVIKFHSLIGSTLIGRCSTKKDLATIVKHHHERFDGKGYPEKLKGYDIPFLSRAVSILDSFDAMTEDRTYKKRMTVEEAIEELKKGRGTQFDTTLTNAFIYMLTTKENNNV